MALFQIDFSKGKKGKEVMTKLIAIDNLICFI